MIILFVRCPYIAQMWWSLSRDLMILRQGQLWDFLNTMLCLRMNQRHFGEKMQLAIIILFTGSFNETVVVAEIFING